MALRAKPPEAIVKRPKIFIYGPAGVGKTSASICFPNSYIIDGERGSENYADLIKRSGSVVFQSTDMAEVIAEVKALLTERHEYKTLVIDPITTIYNSLLEKCEAKVGSDFGRHFGEANKTMKRLANLLMALDMNVVVTAHAKAEYGANLSKLGYTFDGWRQLDYFFDLVIELGKKGKKRFGKVVKTRVAAFPDEDVFEWSYAEVEKRCGVDVIGKPAGAIELASPEQVREIKELLNIVRLPEGTTDNWFNKAGVDVWEDMPAAVIGKCIEFVKNRLPTALTAGDASAEPSPAEAATIKLNELLEARGFDADAQSRVRGAAMKQLGVPLNRFSDDEWKRLYAAVGEGRFDKMNNNGAPVGAGSK